MLVDAATGTLLFAKNPDELLPPASLTKLVALQVVQDELRRGGLHEATMVEIDPRDASPNIPLGSSIMYLRAGMRVSVKDLMLGMAVASGNDAAYTLARLVAGSNEAFAERMNATVRDMGFTRMTFVEPSGLSEINLVTAYEFAQFCRLYLLRNPKALGQLHSVASLAFPREEHAVPGYTPGPGILQYNRNTLLFRYDGCDGLKTGYIIEAGYNLAVTAEREGTRFIAVTLGGTGSSQAGGQANRNRDATALLDWAFARFVTTSPGTGAIPPVRVWFGAEKTLAVTPSDTLAVTVPVGDLHTVTVRKSIPATVDAPVVAGQRIGEIQYLSGDRILRTVPLVATGDIGTGNLFSRFVDVFAKLLHRIFAA